MIYLGFRKVGIVFSAHILCTCAEDLPERSAQTNMMYCKT